MKALKSKIDERFLPVAFFLFDKLGDIDSELTANMKPIDKESWQSITYDSLYANMQKIFGIKNRFFARMLFSFMSERGADSTRISY